MNKIIVPYVIFTVLFCLAQPGLATNEKKKNLPPGLEKKVESGIPLPPGWQKKIVRGEVLDISVYRHGTILVPVDSKGEEIIMIQNRILRILKDSRKIIEILN